MTDEELLRAHVERFNDGVRTGDWDPMLAGLTDDAELVFGGVPVGPFVGRAAIAEAYRAQPPDDEIDILSVVDDGDPEIVARYGWRAEAGRAAGDLRLTRDGDRVRRLVVTFD